ncbi:MAG: response regulator transcription factor [Ectothiorhodospiraceae bacterium]|nr:response regulator transcription factor [Chromatiales bacterium]MCP5153273.1 response regulator transcription factor [Ectothiorhodospiraceae bacterium]
MKILLVDDEALARERLRALVDEIGGHEVVGEAGDGEEALARVANLEPDVVLLDIRMPGMDGLEAARHLAALAQPPAVVFCTAFDDHALKAFESSAVGYLLKPVRRERLEQALLRAGRPTRAQLAAIGTGEAEHGAVGPRTHLSATLHGNLHLVPVSEVRYLRAEHKYVTVRHPGGELIVEDSLTALEREFGERFVRVHRNALVAREHVRALDRDGLGRYLVRLDGIDDRVEVSRRLAGQVRRILRA